MSNTIDNNILNGLFEQAKDMFEDKNSTDNQSIVGNGNTQIGNNKAPQSIQGDNNIQIADGSTSAIGNITININR
jgi:hypothetical protein